MGVKNLEVKNLRISFRTNNGKVQAVRDISFELEKGKTMAIVGESGSGKSVTSRAIMGILAGNAIVEGGEIIYDGKDLLKIGEDEMYRIRGDKIAMIFQDPLSSLNPIMRIGNQITEAMLLKNKASRRESRKDFNAILKLLKANMVAATGNEAQANELTSTFDKFCVAANRLENNYNASASFAQDLLTYLEDVLFRASKNVEMNAKTTLRDAQTMLSRIKDEFFVAKYKAQLSTISKELSSLSKVVKNTGKLSSDVQEKLQALDKLIAEMISQQRPNFFRIGFYAMKHPQENLYELDVESLNEKALTYLNEHFMNTFIGVEEQAIANSHKVSCGKKRAVIDALTKAEAVVTGEFTEQEIRKLAKELSDQVEDSIDRLEIIKDSTAYTFRTALDTAIDKYFAAVKHNPKEQARFERQTRKHDRMVARGKKVDWKVVPMSLHDLDQLKRQILDVILRLKQRYIAAVEAEDALDVHAQAIAVIDNLKEKASKVVNKLSKTMAKEKAIKLMEEVGISEARMRFRQYPFEFSGGMRQRIVIAIALSADPEILICDEPTTALDVTIQAQILELINNLKRERNLSVIFITHDLGVVANMADDIAVMYAGKIVEYGTADDIFYNPRHPYTWALLNSMPDLDTKEKLDAIPGTPPNMIYPPVGDAFAARNKYAMEIDFEAQPPMFQISETHKAATWLLHPDAPKVDVPKTITDRIARMQAKNGGAN